MICSGGGRQLERYSAAGRHRPRRSLAFPTASVSAIRILSAAVPFPDDDKLPVFSHPQAANLNIAPSTGLRGAAFRGLVSEHSAPQSSDPLSTSGDMAELIE